MSVNIKSISVSNVYALRKRHATLITFPENNYTVIQPTYDAVIFLRSQKSLAKFKLRKQSVALNTISTTLFRMQYYRHILLP